jgi:hypothetical protein
MEIKQNSQLPPWVQGPFELINHANDHLNRDGDIDRRMALIGFDNAIEVCIDVYLNLPQVIRDDIQVTRVEAEKAKNNFYLKADFLKRLFSEKNIPDSLPYNEIIWYHKLRNELYHSGNGMVPEVNALKGAKAAALLIFNALFDIDISSRFGKTTLAQSAKVADKPISDAELVNRADVIKQVWASKDMDTFSYIKLLPDGRFGIEVAKPTRKGLAIVTAYIPKENDLQKIEKQFLSEGHTFLGDESSFKK